MVIALILTLALTITVSPAATASGTVVGNGGDPIFDFMEAARASMIETIKLLLLESTERETFCTDTKLMPEQTEFCRQVFTAVAPEILRISQGMDRTRFVLRDEPLLVIGADGKPMAVAARTALGASGPIELHRESVKTLLPTQALFLLTHEFQHKAAYHGHFIDDNTPIGPFASGRDLLDAVASAVVNVARRWGKIGSQFGIRDVFECQVISGTTGFGARISSSRIFQTPDLMSYKTSVGKNPLDGTVYLPETSTTSLELRFEITEPNNCGEPSSARKMIFEIVRATRLQDGSRSDSVIKREESFQNPMCPGADSAFEIAADSVKFACRYYGSEGTTSSPHSLRGLRIQ